MPPPPNVRLFVICDAVVEDPITAKLTLVGITEAFVARGFPVEHPPCVVYARMTGLRGEYDFRFDLVGPDLQTLVSQGAAPESVSVEDPLAPVEFYTPLPVIEFPSPGQYTMRLVYNGRIADEFTFPAGVET